MVDEVNTDTAKYNRMRVALLISVQVDIGKRTIS